MELMARMNQKLNEGYKLTNVTCNYCNGVTMATQKDHYATLYCPKCNKMVEGAYEQQQEQQIVQKPNHSIDEDDQYYERIINEVQHAKDSLEEDKLKNAEANKIDPLDNQNNFYDPQSFQSAASNQISKKLGQKLIQGWTMLEQSCKQCNVPLMKNKKGDKICEGCGKNFAIIIPAKNQKKVQEEKLSTPIPTPVPQQKKKQIIKSAPTNPPSKTSNESQINGQVDRILLKFLRKIENSMDKQYQKNGLKGIQISIGLIQRIKSISNSK